MRNNGCFTFTKHRRARHEVAVLTGLLTVMIRFICQVCLVTNVQLPKKKKIIIRKFVLPQVLLTKCSLVRILRSSIVWVRLV